MSAPAEEERWKPDEALVLTVRTRCLEMKDLSGPDRSWIVASLTVQGWTVAAIADRLKCSLRLVQTIKTEPMTRVALYALEVAAELATERNERAVEQMSFALQATAWEAERRRLYAQRDALVDTLARARGAGPVPHPRRATWTRKGASDQQMP